MAEGEEGVCGEEEGEEGEDGEEGEEGEEGLCGEEARAGVKGKEGGRSTIIIPCQWLDHNFLAGKHIIPGLFEPPLYSH